jgi:RNA polymerase sigma-70 factor (ECF subfamily)
MSAALDSDEQLMLRYAAGDVRAFDMLYRRHELKLWRFICRSVGNRATADELMQDVWFSIIQAAPRYQPVARFTTCSLDDTDEAGGAWVERLASESSREPQQQVESAQQLDYLLSAMEQLPSEQRIAFLLQAEGDLSVEEIAHATAVSFETAKSRLRYARMRLKQALQERA